MTDKLYTQSELDSELSALRERCAKVAENCVFRRTEQNVIGRVRRSIDELVIAIRALPITPHKEEGTR